MRFIVISFLDRVAALQIIMGLKKRGGLATLASIGSTLRPP
jgi:hypothetical protein